MAAAYGEIPELKLKIVRGIRKKKRQSWPEMQRVLEAQMKLREQARR